MFSLNILKEQGCKVTSRWHCDSRWIWIFTKEYEIPAYLDLVDVEIPWTISSYISKAQSKFKNHSNLKD